MNNFENITIDDRVELPSEIWEKIKSIEQTYNSVGGFLSNGFAISLEQTDDIDNGVIIHHYFEENDIKEINAFVEKKLEARYIELKKVIIKMAEAIYD
jgi:hypothetical protein